MLEGEPMARKPTKKEARRRIDDLPGLPRWKHPWIRTGRILETGAKELAKKLVDVDPLNRTAPRSAKPLETITIPSDVRWVPTPSFRPTPTQTVSVPTVDPMLALQTVINDPAIKMNKELVELVNDDDIVLLNSGELARRVGSTRTSANLGPRFDEKKKPRSSKYIRTYKREFNRLKPRFMTKNGKWKKNGFKACVRAAHRATKKLLG